jgi:hypothetical protein
MKTIHAIYENGIFRPTESVELPESCAVEFEPRVVEPQPPHSGDPQFAHLDPKWAEVYAILARSYEGGDPLAAERHNEHQP